jgi:hypothetical protein
MQKAKFDGGELFKDVWYRHRKVEPTRGLLGAKVPIKLTVLGELRRAGGWAYNFLQPITRGAIASRSPQQRVA